MDDTGPTPEARGHPGSTGFFGDGFQSVGERLAVHCGQTFVAHICMAPFETSVDSSIQSIEEQSTHNGGG